MYMYVCLIFYFFTQQISTPAMAASEMIVVPAFRYLMDSVVCFVNTYPLDRDLSGG